MKDLVLKFSYGIVQDAVNVLSYLRKNNPDGDAEEILKTLLSDWKTENEKKQKEDHEKWLKNQPKCPKCNHPMSVRNIPQENKHGYKTHWICSNDECVYEEYSTDDIDAEVKKKLGK